MQRAVTVYQGALILGNDAFPEHERAMIGTHIADALSAIGELTNRANLSDKTVESHIRNIFMKLGVSSRVDVARAIERSRADATAPP